MAVPAWIYFLMLWAVALGFDWKGPVSLNQTILYEAHNVVFVNWLSACCSILFFIGLIGISFLQPNSFPLLFHPLLVTSLFWTPDFSASSGKVIVLCCGGLLKCVFEWVWVYGEEAETHHQEAWKKNNPKPYPLNLRFTSLDFHSHTDSKWAMAHQSCPNPQPLLPIHFTTNLTFIEASYLVLCTKPNEVLIALWVVLRRTCLFPFPKRPLEISKHLFKWRHFRESGKVCQFYTFILGILESVLRICVSFHKKLEVLTPNFSTEYYS